MESVGVFPMIGRLHASSRDRKNRKNTSLTKNLPHLHHMCTQHGCCKCAGMGERALELMGKRALQREAFGRPMAKHGAFAADFARCKIELTAARLTVLEAANALDKEGNKKVLPLHNCIAPFKTHPLRSLISN